MKNLKHYIQERLVVFHQQVDEKLVVNKNYKITKYKYYPESWEELRQIIEDRFEEQGPGTKQKPIDFNDIDVSGIDTFYDINNNLGSFKNTYFEYIDVSNWDVSNVENMKKLFFGCKNLISVGDLSNWNVSKVEYMNEMFFECYNLESIGDLSNWDVSRVTNMHSMFTHCENLESIGDISNWNVSKVKDMYSMFRNCKSLHNIDLSKWDVSNVKEMSWMLAHSRIKITNKPSWYKE